MPASPSDVPTVLVVFGATGDLMERKIVPALFHLREKGHLPEHFRVIGFARRDLAAVFRGNVEEMVRARHATPIDERDVAAFAKAFTYARGLFDEDAAYERLAEALAVIDREWGVCANKLFYLAVPPDNYATIFEHLAGSGLAAGCGGPGPGGWTRIVVEKPFGSDFRTAQELDQLLGSLFDERQIYRIDHYLAKEMLQGIMSFRFSNSLFEPSWNRRAISRIEIDLLETIGAESRGAFYDGVGALRDVGQNHLLQMLALVTMAQPAGTDADAIRAARFEALQRLKPLTRAQVGSCTYRAQYQGFRGIKGVAPDSDTETYFEVVTRLEAGDWRGVPVIMRGGKCLAEACKRVAVVFRRPAPCMCALTDDVENRVTFSLEPTDSITIAFWTKKPGFETGLEERDLQFSLYEREEKAQYVEEYAKLLADAIAGDQTLFVSTDETRAMWEFIDPIVSGWASGATPLGSYTPDTDEALVASAPVSAPEADALRREIGVVGLGKMGAGLALNLVDHGWRVVGFNRTLAVAEKLAAGGLEPAATLADLVAGLPTPRVVWLMVPAGATVDAMLFGEGGLLSLLDEGDTVIDGGNSRWSDDGPRAEKLAAAGIRFVDVGVSGGPAGARAGACLLVGGRREEFELLEPLWADLSVDDGYRHFAGIGAGHFVKMVHNGIEYGMMQAIAEGFTVLKASDYDLDLTGAAAVYNHGSVIESRLVGWLEDAFRMRGPALEGVSGTVAQTGEGRWTLEAAEAEGVRAQVIADAVRFRGESEQDPSWTGQVLSALRERFGGHSVTG